MINRAAEFCRRYAMEKLPYIILALCSLVVTFLELPWGTLPVGGDLLVFTNPSILGRYFSAWNPWVDLGSRIPPVLSGPPFTDQALLSLLSSLQISDSLSAWIYTATFSAIAAVSTAYLFRSSFPQFRGNQAASVL